MKLLNLVEIHQVSGGLWVAKGRCQVVGLKSSSVICCGDGSIKDSVTEQDLWMVPENMKIGIPYLATFTIDNVESTVGITNQNDYFFFELWD